jgi:hypothetical protein
MFSLKLKYIVQKIAKLNNSIIGENSSNLVTLVLGQLCANQVLGNASSEVFFAVPLNFGGKVQPLSGRQIE